MLSKLKGLVASVGNAANHDFCPNLNKYVYWMKKPIGWVVGAIFFSFLIGLFVGPQGYVLAFAFIALLILGLVWPWLSMKGIRCSLVLPEAQMKENETTHVIFKVRNFWPIPVFGMIVEGDFLQDIDSSEEPIAFSLRRVPAFSETEFPLEITPLRRGLLPSGEVRTKNGFPFGLADVARQVEDIKQTLVWPACEPLEGSPPAEGSLFNLLGSMSDRSGNDGDTIGVRCYREGDLLRNIHWAQTVRSQRLMVRERQTPSSTTATVLLDLNPEHHLGEGIHSSFEWAIRIAASVCFQLHQQHSGVRVICIGLPAAERHTESNQHGIDYLMDYMAGLPTLNSLQALSVSETLRTRTENWSSAKQTFFVCTSRSSVQSTFDPDLKPILIELDGFDLKDETFTVHEPVGTPGRQNSMTVTSPGMAASQLGDLWKRSFGRAAG